MTLVSSQKKSQYPLVFKFVVCLICFVDVVVLIVCFVVVVVVVVLRKML